MILNVSVDTPTCGGGCFARDNLVTYNMTFSNVKSLLLVTYLFTSNLNLPLFILESLPVLSPPLIVPMLPPLPIPNFLIITFVDPRPS